MIFVDGALPGPDSEANPSSTTTLWMRDNPPRRLDFPALTALCDLFYPRVYLRQGQVVPAGTISLTIYFHADQDANSTPRATTSCWAPRTQIASRAAISTRPPKIWGRDGALLATTQQIVYFKG